LLNGAIVGFGEVAQHGHWPAYASSDRLTIVAVVDRSESRRAAAAALSPHVTAYASLDDLAASRQPIDFLDVCTPPALHADPIAVAIRQRWHVVCEKPFLLDRELLPRVRAEASSAGIAIVPVHNWKFAPIVRDATARLRRGEIGRLHTVEIDTERLRDFKGADPSRPNWRRDREIAGGGILMDHGWHAVYLALEWFGGRRPLEVDATCRRSSIDAVEDEADMRLRFADGEASIRLTWNGRVRRNTMRLIGNGGVVAIADDRLIVESEGRAAEVSYQPALSAGSHHADWFAAFLSTLSGYFGDPVTSLAPFDEAAICLDVIQAGYRSAAASASAAGWPTTGTTTQR
jgi:predicted dehydrogenase